MKVAEKVRASMCKPPAQLLHAHGPTFIRLTTLNFIASTSPMDIIIIGAGAAGLMAAKLLSEQGQKVCILEPRDRIGGRIHTLQQTALGSSAEAGAEFVHGNLELTLSLFKEAGIEPIEMKGDFWQVLSGKWEKEYSQLEHEELVIAKLKELKENISIAEFLKREFADDKYAGIRQSLLSYVEGYYAGEPDRTSALAFLEEWESEDEQQYRPATGYHSMVNYLAQKITIAGGEIKLSTVVKQIQWQHGQVEVIDEKLNVYKAAKVIVTVPLGVWNADPGEKGAIEFIPGVPQKMQAAKLMGFGAAIKILLKFNEVFWEEQLLKDKDEASFIISDASVRTWWTQYPVRSSLLTGWIAGPPAEKLKNSSADIIYEQVIDSLVYLFNVSKKTLVENIIAWEVHNWPADPFTRGAYAYSTMETKEARKILLQPLERTLFFAGEALYEGTEMGTVEAALVSGRQVAIEVLGTP
jgi:monoamine oxidase